MAVNEMGVGRGEEVRRKGCPYIRQLANISHVRNQWRSAVNKQWTLNTFQQTDDTSLNLYGKSPINYILCCLQIFHVFIILR